MTSLAVALLLLAGSPKKECYRGGCGGEVCSEKDGVITPCEERPENACYRSAKCERQSDGKCGFTQTDELKKCVAKAKR